MFRNYIVSILVPDNASVEKRQIVFIKNPDAHRLVSQQVRRRGPSLDRKKIDAVCKELVSLPIQDSRSPEGILGYDELGLPR